MTKITCLSRSYIGGVFVASCIMFINLANAAIPFSYTGDTGPAYWGGVCTGGSVTARQSPVDIKNSVVDLALLPLELQIFPTTVHLINNDHTIEQVYEHTGSTILFSGIEYELLQFHFHTFSEHVVNSDRESMELHAVFAEPISGDFLVVGMSYKTGRVSNLFIQALIDAGLPRKEGDVIISATTIDLSTALINTQSYYTYKGSLTTPPCTENVTWVVLKEPSTLTQQQWSSFREILGNNFRPLQNINDRKIKATGDYYKKM